MSIYTLSDLGNFKQSDWLAISDYDIIFTALGGEYKAEQKSLSWTGCFAKVS